MRRTVAIIAFVVIVIGGLAAAQRLGSPVDDEDARKAAGVGAGPDVAAPSQSEDGEPSREECLSAIEKVRALANALPADHPSRYVAERHVRQSLAEAGNGEYDDCLYWTERATEEVRELRHGNEKIKVLQADEQPATTEAQGKVAEKKPGRKKSRE